MKLYRNIIIVVAALAALGAAMYFVTKHLPENENSVVSQQPMEEDMFNVYKMPMKNIPLN